MAEPVRKGPPAGPGQPDQLEQGGAKQVNDAQVQANAITPAPEAQELPVQYDQPGANLQSSHKPTDEWDQILYGPPEGVQMDAGALAAKSNQPDITRVKRFMPLLAEYARNPDAPSYVRAAYRLMAQAILDNED